MSWIIAVTVSVLYLLISVISHKWEVTWVIWIEFYACLILLKVVMKNISIKGI